jgi:hypothetical protein
MSELSDTERVQTFKWALYAFRRLTPVELCFAVQFESAGQMATFTSWRQSDLFIEKGVQMERFIRSRSRGLLEIRTIFNQNSASRPSEVVQFVHQTVPEFLVRAGFATLFKYVAFSWHVSSPARTHQYYVPVTASDAQLLCNESAEVRRI